MIRYLRRILTTDRVGARSSDGVPSFVYLIKVKFRQKFLQNLCLPPWKGD